MMQMWFLAQMAKARFSSLIRDEKGEVNIVATVVLIGIAVILALVFKEGIEKLLKSLIDTITGQAQKAVSGK